MFEKQSISKFFSNLVDGNKPVSTLNERERGLANKYVENKSLVHIPTYKPENFPELLFESNFYCLPGYETWAKVCYYGRILGDTTIYNKKDNAFVFLDARYKGIFEIHLSTDAKPTITIYPDASLPFYKEGVKLSQLVGTTFLAGRLLGYKDDAAYIPDVLVPQ